MKELRLTGSVTENEVRELNSQFDDLRVVYGQVKGLTLEELVQIVFHDLTVYTFTRDFILDKALEYSLGQIKKVYKYFKTKGKGIKSTCIEIQIRQGDKEFLMNICSKGDRIELALKLASEQMIEIMATAKEGQHIQVNLPQDSLELEIRTY